MDRRAGVTTEPMISVWTSEFLSRHFSSCCPSIRLLALKVLRHLHRLYQLAGILVQGLRLLRRLEKFALAKAVIKKSGNTPMGEISCAYKARTASLVGWAML